MASSGPYLPQPQDQGSSVGICWALSQWPGSLGGKLRVGASLLGGMLIYLFLELQSNSLISQMGTGGLEHFDDLQANSESGLANSTPALYIPLSTHRATLPNCPSLESTLLPTKFLRACPLFPSARRGEQGSLRFPDPAMLPAPM